MIPLLRAECRKLLSARSTYVIVGVALLFISFMSFFIDGFSGTAGNPGWLMSLISNATTVVSIFVAITAILLMGHEYRYNTIVYTLTSANSRITVMLAKIVAVTGYALAFTLASWLLAVLAYVLGANLSPNEGQMVLAPDLDWAQVWHSAYFVVAFGLIGLLLAFWFRHLVGAIASLFIWPAVEVMLSPLLKQNAHYLPLSLLDHVHGGINSAPSMPALWFLAYMVVAWLLTGYLFIRRDAN